MRPDDDLEARLRSFHHEPAKTVEHALNERFARRRTRPKWSWATAVMVALVLGFVGGRMSVTRAPVETATTIDAESATHDFAWVPADEDLVEVTVAVRGGRSIRAPR